ncbi:MAG TPA: Rne/Rng family ribonuclease, partial [Roseiarcus sp.]|nr:Rne/Rng family ribonuclease [Roseiarcus sp.]
MANKMIIDASHPEETRVVVLRGNRVEEFDFESANKKPLRGNIYLAKVTRVEPSLQAAFVDYGGNRHGFLAFSEIHPDYYQIPVADRQALLEEEERAHGEEENEENRSDRRSRRHRRPRRHEAELRAQGDERVTEPAEFDGQASSAAGEEAAPTAEPNFDQPTTSEAEAAFGDVAPAAQEASEPVAASFAEPEPAETTGLAERAEPEAASAEAGEIVAGEAQGEGEAHASEVEVHAEALDHPRHDEAPHDEEAAEADNHDDDRSEVTTLDGGEEIAPEARAAHEEHEEEGEPVEQVGGDAMEELPRRPPRLRRQYKIQEVIKRRQVLLVQVVKEERGNKGAALTTYLSLAGRYSVLMPNTARGGGISRKITNSADRSRLKSIAQDLDVPEGMGVILRTAGAMRTKAEVKRDFEYLLRMWETVREKTLASTAPTLVYEEGSLIKRAIRDLYNKDIDEVMVAGEEGYREAKEFMRLLMPSHARNVQLYRDPQPVFAKAGVEAQLDALFSNHVTLKSGGYLVINQTEALVAIDVNSGRSTREHNIEDTALRTNLEAADEVARQLRLRDLAGLIVVDFIDMEEGRNNRAVERRIKDALKNDRARIQIGRISHFGLLEMSRQRIRTGVLEGSTVLCPHCMGAGVVRSTASIALHVLRVLEDALIKSSTHDLNVRTRGEVALYILNQKRSHLRDLERRFGVTIMVLADDSLAGAIYHVLERGEPATGVKLGETEARETSPPPVEEADEIEAETEEESEAESQEEEAEGADEGAGPEPRAEGAPRREDGEGGRRRRRRRRRRSGGREPGDVSSADAPQPTDAGLAAVAEIDGEQGARSRDEAEGPRRGDFGRRSGGWRRDGRDRNRPRRGDEQPEAPPPSGEDAPALAYGAEAPASVAFPQSHESEAAID